MNNDSFEHEQDVASTTLWLTRWECPRCKRQLKASEYKRVECECGILFDVRKQFSGANTRDPYVIMLSRGPRVNWPVYEVK